MQHLADGSFFGNQVKMLRIDGLIISESESDNREVGWHTHENAHLSYSIYGNSYLVDKNNRYPFSSGTLMYHNSANPHRNTIHSNYSRNFYLEIKPEWLRKMDIQYITEGIVNIEHPSIRNLFDSIFIESRVNDNVSGIGIESYLITILSFLEKPMVSNSKKPGWVDLVKDYILSQPDKNFTLTELSSLAEVHPVHLSRDFTKHFGQTITEYLRQLKIQKATELIKFSGLQLTEISHLSGFADQSHMIRCFKKAFNVNPSTYRRRVKNSD